MNRALNIGCGADVRKSTEDVDWWNVDADPEVKARFCLRAEEVGKSFLAVTFDHIEANDILEHVKVDRWRACLNGWVRLLKPGGTMRVQVPDPHAVMQRFQEGKIDEATLNRVIYGESTGEFDRHYQLISMERLGRAMMDAGLEVTEASILHICGIVIGRKP